MKLVTIFPVMSMSISKITGTLFFLANINAFNAASLEGDAANNVPEISRALSFYVFFIYIFNT